MSDFRQLSDRVWASPQISPAEAAEAGTQGFTLIVNNRPDGEAPDQPEGAAIEAAARDAGVDYAAIPITHAGFSEDQVAQMERLLGETDGRILAYCRSGTRSTLLWALASAKAGADPDELSRQAAGAGYDLAPVRPVLDAYAARRDGS